MSRPLLKQCAKQPACLGLNTERPVRRHLADETSHWRFGTLYTYVHSHDTTLHAEGAGQARAFKVLDATPRARSELHRCIQNDVGVMELGRLETHPESLSRLRLQRLQRAKLGLHACSLCTIRVPNVCRLLPVRSQRAARCEVRSLRLKHRPGNVKHRGCQHTLLEVDQALFIVDVVDQQRAANIRDHFRDRTAPGKARQVRVLHSTEVEAAEVQSEGKSQCVWGSFGYALGTIRGVVTAVATILALTAQYFSRESFEAGPNTTSPMSTWRPAA